MRWITVEGIRDAEKVLLKFEMWSTDKKKTMSYA